MGALPHRGHHGAIASLVAGQAPASPETTLVPVDLKVRPRPRIRYSPVSPPGTRDSPLIRAASNASRLSWVRGLPVIGKWGTRTRSAPERGSRANMLARSYTTASSPRTFHFRPTKDDYIVSSDDCTASRDTAGQSKAPNGRSAGSCSRVDGDPALVRYVRGKRRRRKEGGACLRGRVALNADTGTSRSASR